MARVKLSDAINRVQNNENDTEAVRVIIKAIKGFTLERLFENIENEAIECEYDFNEYVNNNNLEYEDTLADGLRRANDLITQELEQKYEVYENKRS